MKRIVLTVLGVVVLLVIGGVIKMMQKPDMSQYEVLKTPRISVRNDQKVLEVQFAGKPDEVLGPAFRHLFGTYFTLKGAPKGARLPAPLARYESGEILAQTGAEITENFGQTVWKGAVALPVPDAVTELPAAKPGAPLQARLTTWQYGKVAEILHLGPYDQEVPAIEKLRAYVKSQGYVIIGPHEEEYLIGPGRPFTKPADYYTIIRYRVQKAGQAASSK